MACLVLSETLNRRGRSGFAFFPKDMGEEENAPRRMVPGKNKVINRISTALHAVQQILLRQKTRCLRGP